MNSRKTAPRTNKLPKPKLVLMAISYLCVLAIAIGIDGTVEAQAEYRELVAEAQVVQRENLSAVAAARTDAMKIAGDNASVLAAVQHQEQLVRDKAAAEAAAEAAKKNPSSTAAPAPVSNFGKFNADAYAGGFDGRSKVAYYQGVTQDAVGYLKMPGTNIAYPVLQNKQDINYYTERDIYQNYVKGGSVCWTNPDTVGGSSSSMSPNTVIYGHNWTNYSGNPRIGGGGDRFFAQLTGYHHLSMAKTYPYFYYSTAQENMVFKIFACFYTETQFNYIATSGGQGIIDEAMLRSRHNFNTDVNSSDKIITLSTCTRAYGATNNQRFVVMGRLLRPGESITEVNVVGAPNHKQPSVW